MSLLKNTLNRVFPYLITFFFFAIIVFLKDGERMEERSATIVAFFDDGYTFRTQGECDNRLGGVIGGAMGVCYEGIMHVPEIVDAEGNIVVPEKTHLLFATTDGMHIPLEVLQGQVALYHTGQYTECAYANMYNTVLFRVEDKTSPNSDYDVTTHGIEVRYFRAEDGCPGVSEYQHTN